jgi:hypothetical protein
MYLDLLSLLPPMALTVTVQDTCRVAWRDTPAGDYGRLPAAGELHIARRHTLVGMWTTPMLGLFLGSGVLDIWYPVSPRGGIRFAHTRGMEERTLASTGKIRY